MMRSLFSGVAGLKTHQTKMDVIGNNIANVNTTAYKSQSITFSDLLYQTTQNASAANAASGVGGTNARQIGLGSKTGAISTAITSQGSAQSTNNPFDIMITGDSFFVVSNGNDNFFTRDGSFCVDGVGNLVMSSTGYTVQGWQSDENGNIIQDKVSALQIMTAKNMTYPPEATSKAYVSGIIDKNDTNVNGPNGKVMSLSFYDSLGYQYNARFSVHDVDGDKGQFYVQLDDILDSEGKVIDSATGSIGTTSVTLKDSFAKTNVDEGNIVVQYNDPTTGNKVWGIFAGKERSDIVDDKGNFVTGKSEADNLVKGKEADSATILGLYSKRAQAYNIDPEDPASASTIDTDTVKFDPELGIVTFSYTKAVDNGLSLAFDPTTGKFAGIGASFGEIGATNTTIKLSFAGEEPGNFETIEIDFSNTTMFNNNGTSTVSATSGDTTGLGTGRRLGEMSGVSVSKDGIITATYDNGQNKILGQIAVANFANAAGLEKAGDNLYSATPNSGEFDGIGEDITASGNYMTTGVLEMSNVDLAQEFTDMITTQRGFQANSRIITVSDTLLEELTNLKR